MKRRRYKRNFVWSLSIPYLFYSLSSILYTKMQAAGRESSSLLELKGSINKIWIPSSLVQRSCCCWENWGNRYWKRCSTNRRKLTSYRYSMWKRIENIIIYNIWWLILICYNYDRGDSMRVSQCFLISSKLIYFILPLLYNITLSSLTTVITMKTVPLEII